MVGTILIISALMILLTISISGLAVCSNSNKIRKLGAAIWWNAHVLIVVFILLLASGFILVIIDKINATIAELQDSKIISISDGVIIYSIDGETRSFVGSSIQYAEVDKPKIKFDDDGILKRVIVEMPVEGITDFDVEGE